MRVFVIVLFIFLAFFIFIYITPLRIKTSYWRVRKDDKFTVNIELMWGLIKFNLREPDVIIKNRILAPVLKVKANIGSVNNQNIFKDTISYKFRLTELKEIYDRINQIVLQNDDVIRYLLGSIRVSDFIWVTNYGLKNPAYTGMVYGLFWSVKSIIFNFLQGKVKKVLNKPKFEVKPNFFNQEFSTHISCIFALNLGHIITASLKILTRRIYKRG